MAARRATQADVARLAGVSQATVSIVLSGGDAARGRVGADTERRVREAMRITGYTANPLAQGLAKGRNGIVGVFTYESVFPRTGDDFYRPFLVGVEGAAERLGFDVLLFTSAPVRDGRRELTSPDGWNRLGITDGCLLLGRHNQKRDLVDLSARRFPFVFIGRRESPDGPVPYVGADYAAATQRVVDHLLRLGHRRVGFLGDLGPEESSADRVRGYREAMMVAGLRPVLLDQAVFNPGEAVDLVTDNRLTAVVLGADYDAAAIAAAATARGLDVPRDLSLAILGEPERPLGDGPTWTGFHTPRVEMGAGATELVATLIATEDLAEVDIQRLLPCPFVEGETTSPPQLDD